MGNSPKKLTEFLEEEDFPKDQKLYGFSNIGNNCYINSVLQSLYHCEKFKEKIIEFKKNQTENEKETFLLENLLSELFCKINDSEKQIGSISPSNFVKKFLKKTSNLRYRRQEDAHEFFETLMDSFEQSIQKSDQISQKGKQELSLIYQLFSGEENSFIKCLECGSIRGPNVNKFVDIPLDIFLNESLQSCLKRRNLPEKMDGDNKIFCEKCNKNTSSEKFSKIVKFPKILVFQFKRFQFTMNQGQKKLFEKILFPFELKVEEESKKGIKTKHYDLNAIVVHIGKTIKRGHYISYSKVQDKWFCFDDSKVSLADPNLIEFTFGVSSLEPKKRQTSYLLFYTKKN
ncbi:ubiquitin carboxyl-terminal hydrolase [Anaeramoeba ignava]|uniref:ubiquitinyl hydrolase 1 n=1 Tax=Anaeramoeba ignava TaxID=1746090 RepID=A0A9Q0REK2_ANAIG|nr:ubiquitin carboxyl-terminal hydrolase [Anaeramoeba ignava]